LDNVIEKEKTTKEKKEKKPTEETVKEDHGSTAEAASCSKHGVHWWKTTDELCSSGHHKSISI